jgi:hypothetical protein
VRIPSDVELSFAFRELARRIGVGKAWTVIGILWSHLAIQARSHRRCGIYEGQWISHLWEVLKRADVPDAAPHLTDSHLIEPAGKDFYCALFHASNPELDGSYVPDGKSWKLEWEKFRDRQVTDTKQSVDLLPAECWIVSGGSIPASLMNRAWVLVNTLDLITARKGRKPESMTPLTMQAAARVVSQHSEAKLSIVLRRFLSMSRPKNNPILPLTTQECLANFDDLILAVMPTEGFCDWLKKTETPPDYETPKRQADAIRDELLGVPVPEPDVAGSPATSDSAVDGGVHPS